MDDFQRMMAMENVRPIGAKAPSKPRSPATPARSTHSPSTHRPALATTTKPVDPDVAAWAGGALARRGLDTAMERLADELHVGHRGWATGIRADGTAMALPTKSGAAHILSIADKDRLLIIVIGGDGWTFVMHPLMGVATIDNNPKGDPA